MIVGLNLTPADPYDLTISREITHQLTNGTYHLLFEYPDMNGRTDLELNITKKSDLVINRSGNVILNLSVVRSGGMNGDVAVNIIETAIGATGGKQMVERTTMNVSEAWIFIKPVGNHVIGDKIFINGTTNIAGENRIIVQIIAANYTSGSCKTMACDGPPPTFPVIKGECGINSWSVFYDTTWSKRETMIITAAAEIEDASAFQRFDIT